MLCNDVNERKASRCDRDAGHAEESHFDSQTGWHWTDPRPADNGRIEADDA